MLENKKTLNKTAKNKLSEYLMCNEVAKRTTDSHEKIIIRNCQPRIFLASQHKYMSVV